MSSLLFSGTVLTAFLGGVVALLAPCCISVMLPAYFATSFHRRVQLAAMTLVFAAGIATIILPLGLGASAISRLLIGQHRLLFTVGGALMIAAGVAILAGWKFMLPMPGRRGGGGRGVGSVYSLGLFSGAASACCAPVLAGVAALAGAAASFPVAVTVGVAYVAGMVAPLAVLALIWDKRDWGRARIFGDWGITLRAGGWRRRIPGPALLSGGLMAVMGVLTIVFALRGPAMTLSGWQLQVTAWLGHTSAVIEHHLTWLPGWTGLLLLAAVVAGFVRAARRRTDDDQENAPIPAGSPQDLDAELGGRWGSPGPLDIPALDAPHPDAPHPDAPHPDAPHPDAPHPDAPGPAAASAASTTAAERIN
ncbi:Cytochrome c biogenesis protein CcdA [Modestobacter sp. DSM 44400]|uniref:cytochrome c biogenesis CcdA family protein n=1 Tax=Modestobacter sp. DSM 44400 TaxID=1550230 RepID=UPI0008991860|nr:cytochrome c biogenesis protein CcdA [Modestobacter sp. DSM 44400]SDY65821.1 Cytochrome c biogenesis protein CcdA [Modestobacter sp. DSM 44400]